MSIAQRFFNEALRDMQRSFALLEEPLATTAHRSFARLRYPATDIKETPDAYELHADLPGFDKNNIQIDLTDSHTLLLRGHNETTTSTSSADVKNADASSSSSTAVAEASNNAVSTTAPWWTNERVTGSFSRSFRFPVSVKGDEIKATYKDGILSITVPKMQSPGSTRIPIE